MSILNLWVFTYTNINTVRSSAELVFNIQNITLIFRKIRSDTVVHTDIVARMASQNKDF